ncbi:MAG: hypothetical protein HXX17_14760 [Geobacteraceae bacterium]|nr:hypothetical protein [Geobacteraceae bacterium]
MKRIILTAILILCTSSAFASEYREQRYGHDNEQSREDHYRREYRHQRHDNRWNHRDVAYRTEYRYEEPFHTVQLPPLPALPPLPPLPRLPHLPPLPFPPFVFLR